MLLSESRRYFHVAQGYIVQILRDRHHLHLSWTLALASKIRYSWHLALRAALLVMLKQ
jgi:hypothetical protein